jgi:hypothetical protein
VVNTDNGGSVLRRMTDDNYAPILYRPVAIERRQNKAHNRPSLRVRLYWKSKRRYIEFHRLVWMARTLSSIPTGWEIHHRNGDQEDNRWENLYCLHPEDHKKLHRVNEHAETVLDDLIDEPDNLPF